MLFLFCTAVVERQVRRVNGKQGKAGCSIKNQAIN
jgi:hypothetical protein